MKTQHAARVSATEGGHPLYAFSSRGAFTLIELLVVITVIALMAALLLPALTKSRFRAKAAACAQNMRQIGVAWQMYADDNDGWFPQNYMEGRYWAKTAGQAYFYEGIQTWMVVDPWPPPQWLCNGATNSTYSGIGYLWPYIGNPKVFYCPANPVSQDWLNDWWYGNASDSALNCHGFGIQARGTVCTYIYRNAMFPVDPNPTTSIDQFPMIIEPKRINDERLRGRVLLTDYWFGMSNDDPFLPPNTATLPHGGNVVNLLWTDGHVSAWQLPDGILPIWGWFGGASYTLASFQQDFYWQCPWWWVEADRSGR